MKTVHFLIDRSRIVDYLVTPVRANLEALKERGYRIRFFRRISDRALSCDILGLVSKPTLSLVGESHTVIPEDSPTVELLKKAGRKTGKVIWFDSSDSTGVTHFELLPYVDLYLKKQLLRDRDLYLKPMYGGRIYSDYYHREFGVEDSAAFEQFYPLREEYRFKVDLSWNIGLGEHYDSFSWRNKLRRLLPGLIPPRLDPPCTDPHRERPHDLFLRASTDWPRESVVFHRRALIERLQEFMGRHPQVRGSVSRRTDRSDDLSLEEYRTRMKRTKITFGPFGWGELNLREYEALMFGALLFRPDISHMETWPDIFRDEETCVFYAWDFSDLEDRLVHYMNHDKQRRKIAVSGQDEYKALFSAEGMKRFCDWFVQQIER